MSSSDLSSYFLTFFNSRYIALKGRGLILPLPKLSVDILVLHFESTYSSTELNSVPSSKFSLSFSSNLISSVNPDGTLPVCSFANTICNFNSVLEWLAINSW